MPRLSELTPDIPVQIRYGIIGTVLRPYHFSIVFIWHPRKRKENVFGCVKGWKRKANVFGCVNGWKRKQNVFGCVNGWKKKENVFGCLNGWKC